MTDFDNKEMQEQPEAAAPAPSSEPASQQPPAAQQEPQPAPQEEAAAPQVPFSAIRLCPVKTTSVVDSPSPASAYT